MKRIEVEENSYNLMYHYIVSVGEKYLEGEIVKVSKEEIIFIYEQIIAEQLYY